jgi:hypothetical protein
LEGKLLAKRNYQSNDRHQWLDVILKLSVKSGRMDLRFIREHLAEAERHLAQSDNHITGRLRSSTVWSEAVIPPIWR